MASPEWLIGALLFVYEDAEQMGGGSGPRFNPTVAEALSNGFSGYAVGMVLQFGDDGRRDQNF